MALNNLSLLDDEDEDLVPQQEEQVDPNNLDLAALPDENEEPSEENIQPEAPQEDTPLDAEGDGDAPPASSEDQGDGDDSRYNEAIKNSPRVMPALSDEEALAVPQRSAQPVRTPAQQRLSQAYANEQRIANPEPPKGWRQKAGAIARIVGAGAAGFTGGYLNANPRGRPVDTSDLVGSILYPGKARAENEVATARQQVSDEEHQEQINAQAEERRQRAADFGAREQQRKLATDQRAKEAEQKIEQLKSERYRKSIADTFKGREGDVSYQSSSDQRPAGWEFVPNREDPGNGWAAPPRFRPAPPELLPFLPGVKAGDQISHSEFKSAAQAMNKTNLENTKAANKPDKEPTGEYQGLVRQYTDKDGNIDYAAANKAWEASQLKRASAGRATFSIPGVSMSPTKLTGEDYLKTLPPSVANEVKAMAEGRTAVPSASARTQAAQQKRFALFQYDPDFSEQRAQIRKAFTTGKAGDNIGALNTATAHIDQLDDVAKAMGNGSFVPGNQVWNAARTMFGSSAPTNFDQVKAAVASEMASALKGNATDAEISKMNENLSRAGSPNQLSDAINENLHILGAKLNTYHERYTRQIPNDQTWNPILPTARGVFDKHGFDPTAPVNAGGAGGASPRQGFVRTATGKDGHQIGQTKDGTWYDAQTGKKLQ